MKKFSHSRVETFNSCKYKYKLRYVDKLKTLPNTDPQNPLIIGTALHHGIEQDVKTAIKEYYMSFPVISTLHVYEAIKLEHWIPRVKQLIDTGNPLTFEFEINSAVFHGFIDLIEELTDGTVAIYDFKYSNNIDHYLESPQLHLYKYYYEMATEKKVSKIGFIFVPKVFIRQKKTETEIQFIKRLKIELEKKSIQVKEVDYDESKVKEFKESVMDIISEMKFEKNKSRLCDFCEFKDYCLNGIDLDIIRKGENEMLPSTERVDLRKASKKKIWLYGAPFSGKTTFADQAPTPLNLNTDGNVKYVTMPRLPIKDEITKDGRIVKKKLAWDVFKDAIDELEPGSEFETIVVDLLEDTQEYCRLFMYEKLSIEHESDDSFRAWDKVRIEFLSTLKRLINLDYNIILCSHEDKTKDFTKRTGDKISSIRPNINEKLASKVAGMVDIVARVVVEEDGSRYLQFKQDETIFGGGRLKGITTTQCELSWEALMKVYDEANSGVLEYKPEPKPQGRAGRKLKSDEPVVVEELTPIAEEPTVVESSVQASNPVEEQASPEESKQGAPVRKTRQRKARD